MRIYRTLVVLGAICAPGCGSAPARGITTSEAQASPAAPAHGPRPGAEPPDLDATLRITNLARDWEHIRELVPASGEVAELFGIDLDVAARAVFGDVLGESVDLSSPIDVTIASPAPEQTLAVASVRIKSFDGTKRALEPLFALVPRKNGGIELRPRATGHLGMLHEQSFGCELHRSGADGEGRLICSQEGSAPDDHVAHLLARAQRSDRQESSFAVHVASHRWTEFVSGPDLDPDAGDTDAERLGSGLMKAALNDIDRVLLDVTLGHGKSDVGLELRFSKTTSILSSVLLSHASERALPDSFWDTPRDALLALQWEGMAPGARREDVESLMHKISEIEPDLDPAGRDALAKANGAWLLRGGAVWVVAGCDLDDASGVLRNYLGKSSTDQEALARARSALSGWTMVGMPDPLEHWKTARARQLVRGAGCLGRAVTTLAILPCPVEDERDALLGFGRRYGTTQPMRSVATTTSSYRMTCASGTGVVEARSSSVPFS